MKEVKEMIKIKIMKNERNETNVKHEKVNAIDV